MFMINGDESIHNTFTDGGMEFKTGLTFRQYFAGLAMQGLCAGGRFTTGSSQDIAQGVEKSVKIAEALIERLNSK